MSSTILVSHYWLIFTKDLIYLWNRYCWVTLRIVASPQILLRLTRNFTFNVTHKFLFITIEMQNVLPLGSKFAIMGACERDRYCWGYREIPEQIVLGIHWQAIYKGKVICFSYICNFWKKFIEKKCLCENLLSICPVILLKFSIFWSQHSLLWWFIELPYWFKFWEVWPQNTQR